MFHFGIIAVVMKCPFVQAKKNNGPTNNFHGCPEK